MANLIRHTCRQTIRVLITSCTVFALVQVLHVDSYNLNSLDNSEHEQRERQTHASESLKSLQSKLDLILDTENHEKKLLESLLFENEQNENKQEAGLLPLSSPTPASKQPSLESIVQKLVDNSGRMESMIGMLSDFKTILSQTIATQEKQLGYKTEVIELREEVNYLRDEIQKMKSQQAASDIQKSDLGSKYQNKIHNDEAIINWLKDTVQELRHEIVEVSSSLNVTGLLHLQQQLRLQEKSATRDVQGVQRRIESLQLNNDQVNEQLLELQADVANVRTWQAKMGQRLVTVGDRDQNPRLSQNSIETTQDKDATLFDSRLKLLRESLEASSKISKKNNNKNGRRHSKKQVRLELELYRVEKVLLEMAKDQSVLAHKVKELEMGSSPSMRAEHEKVVWKKVVQSNSNDDDSDDGLVTITYEDDNEVNTDTQRRKRSTLPRRRRRDEVHEYSSSRPITEIRSRVLALEKSLADYSNSLDLMDNKVSGLNELHTTTRSLFTSLETIENKYDLKITELQTTMAKVEASMSAVQVATDELKEQQNLQNQAIQSCKKETRALSQSMQTTQLRVASLQNQILKWGLKLCEASNSESIQDLKIASVDAH